MVTVDFWNQNRIHFYKHTPGRNFFNSCQLVFNQNLCSFNSSVNFSVIDNPVVELRFNFRVNCIYSYSQRINSSFNYFISFFCKQKTVRTHTANQIWKFLFYNAERFQRKSCCQSIPRACNSHHRDFRTTLKSLTNI